MIRVRISNFIKEHKDKIKDLGRKLIIVAMIVFIVTIILSASSKVNNDIQKEDTTNVYKPTQTIILGSDISQEQYEKDSDLVNKFIEYCNNKQVEEAYNLLSDECKQESYPTIERFRENYYNYIFAQKKECNLQSWISTSNYTIYKVRYTNNMLATGIYNENDVYQDYLTLNKKNDKEKISIGNFVDSEECNILTKTDYLEATVIKKKTYLLYEEYEIDIKNISEKTILLNNLTNSKTIKLIANSGTEFAFDMNALLIEDFIIEQNEIKRIVLRFLKNFSSNDKSEEINFKDIIKDYYTYKENEETYTDTLDIKIRVED